MQATPTTGRGIFVALTRWLDSSVGPETSENDDRIDWLRTLPFIALHLACFAVIWVGVSRLAVEVAVVLYCVRMFALTGFYHRYFSHKSFRTSRPVQFAFAAVGATCVQRGPLWWAAHHRNHHRYADSDRDPHSPRVKGFIKSHVGWFLTRRGFRTDWTVIPDFARFAELRLLDRFDILMPVLMSLALFLWGHHLHAVNPQSGVTGLQLVVWGLCISTVVLFHATFLINSMAHGFGRRRFDLRDDSCNNWLLALITFGEGWHNNHHRYPNAARQGMLWWEYDLTYYGLVLLSWLGLVRDLRQYPASMYSRTPVAVTVPNE